jgi:hypothetical protein
MGQCMGCAHKKRTPLQGTISQEPTADVGGPGQLNRKDTQMTRFFSFDIDASSNHNHGLQQRKTLPLPIQSLGSTNEIARCERTGEHYGHRQRIPSHVNMESFDSEYWWSGANLQRPAIAHDMGPSPTILSRPIKVTVVPSSFFASNRDFDLFPEYKELCGQRGISSHRNSLIESSPTTTVGSPSVVTDRCLNRLLIFKIKMADKVMVSLNEVMDPDTFDRLLTSQSRDDLLKKKLKLILSPVNSPLPIPAKKPKDAETIGSYFGMENVDFYVDESLGNVKVVSILVNIYAKWIIRKFMPLLTASRGRMCDFVLLSSDDRVIFADFRLLATQVSQALIAN